MQEMLDHQILMIGTLVVSNITCNLCFLKYQHSISTLAWIPGQGVRIDYAAIIEILIEQLDGERQLCILSW